MNAQSTCHLLSSVPVTGKETLSVPAGPSLAWACSQGLKESRLFIEGELAFSPMVVAAFSAL